MLFPGVLVLCLVSFLRCPFLCYYRFCIRLGICRSRVLGTDSRGATAVALYLFALHCQIYVPEEDVFSYFGVALDGGGLPLRLHEVVLVERVSDVLVAWLCRVRIW